MGVIFPILILMMAAGSWAAWRKSPLYSGKTTLKVVGVMAVICGVIVGAVNLKLSENAGIAVNIGLVLLMGPLATGLVVHFTDSHVAQLPASARIETTHRHRVQRWMLRLLVFEVICGAAALVLKGDWRMLPLMVGGLMLLISGTVLTVAYVRARRLDLGMSEVMASPWAHWKYSPEEWKAWADNQLQWERSLASVAWPANRKQLIMASGMFWLFFLGCSVAIMQASFKMEALAATGSAAAVMLLLIGINRFSGSNCDRRYGKLLKAPAETWFGDEGLFCNGEYMQWVLSGSYLLEADTVLNPPQRLVLVFMTYKGSYMVRVVRRVPVPTGCDADLEILQRKLSILCQRATIRIYSPTAAR